MHPPAALAQHPLAESFKNLSPQVAIEAIESSGKRATGQFLVLNSYENRVYQFELEDGGSIIGKFYRPGRWQAEAIAEEHAFVAELQAAHIPVIAPLALPHTHHITAPTLGQIDGIYYALYPRIAGRTPQEFGETSLDELGRILANIHLVGEKCALSTRATLNPTTFGYRNLDYLLASNSIPESLRDNFAATARLLLETIEPLFSNVRNVRIHGDCHLGNILVGASGVTFLDFDDAINGPAVQDVWMLVPSYDEQGRQQREHLLQAYERVRPFPRAELQLIEPLRALRYLNYATWIAKRWHDPTFKATFSFFGTEMYWQKELQDLREQLARLQAF